MQTKKRPHKRRRIRERKEGAPKVIMRANPPARAAYGLKTERLVLRVYIFAAFSKHSVTWREGFLSTREINTITSVEKMKHGTIGV